MSAGSWLVADVGGTNARFALLDGPGGPLRDTAVLPTGGHTGLDDAAAAYLARHAPGVRVERACFGVAGPVDASGAFRLTNADWVPGTAAGVRDALGLRDVAIINDFEALVWGIARLGDADVTPVGPRGDRSRAGTIAAVGPGTGLGVAAMVQGPCGPVAVPGEGGHVDVPAVTDTELDVARMLRDEHGSASAELLLSGEGIARLHGYLARLRGRRPEPLTPAQILSRRGDPDCRATLEMFCALLGGVAGNAALTFGARSVFLGGGILPRIADVLAESEFRARFEARGPRAGFTADISTWLITHPRPALLGAAERLASEYAGQRPAVPAPADPVNGELR